MIKKITDLKIAESFIQVNYIKGYKYIDRAREIVNEFYVNDKEPVFYMDLNNLIIHNPEQNIAEVKVSPKMYWTHFIEPDSLDLISDVFAKKSEKITNILDIEKIQRIGWRTYFVKEFNKESERDQVFNRFNISENIEFENGIFTLKNKDYKAKIRVRKATKNDDNKTAAIIIDIDLFEIFQKATDKSNIKSFLNKFKTELRSDFWLNEINRILNKKDENAG